MNIGTVETSSVMMGPSVTATAPLPQPGNPEMQVSRADTAVNHEKIKQVVEEMQKQIDSMNVSLHYSTYGDHGERTAVAVINKETGELIREIPSKEIQHLYAKMSELAGKIFNRQV